MAEEYILIVDDEELIRKQAEVALRKGGYKTATAGDAQTALSLIRQQPPDLLLTDIRMPDMDGLQLFGAARKITPDLMAVMMTAHGTIDTAIKAMQLGVQGFLQKPFTASELERAVQDALQKSRVAREAVRLRVLNPLLEARRMLATEFDLSAFCRTMVEVIARETQSDYCAVFLPAEAGTALNSEATFISPNSVKSFSPKGFPAGRLAARSVELSRTLSLRRSAGTENQPPETEAVPGVVIAVPLLIGGNALGALLVGRAQVENTFSPGERELFEVIAGQLANLVENRRLFRAVAEREERLRLFIGKFVAIQEEERKLLSQRIRDDLLPLLTGGRQNLQGFIEKVRPSNNSELMQAEQRFKESISEARRLMYNLRPTELDEFGLTAALRQYVRDLNDDPDSICRPNYRLEGQEAPRMDSAVETALYRAVQEAITNACKHAKGSQVEALVRVQSVKGKPTRIQIEVRDWGRGFDTNSLRTGEPSRKAGLLAMQERVALIGGTCQIESAPGRGTVVTITYDLTS